MVAFSDRVVVPWHVEATATRLRQLATTEPTVEVAYNKLSKKIDLEPELLRHNLTELLGQSIEYALLRVAPTDVASLPEI